MKRILFSLLTYFILGTVASIGGYYYSFTRYPVWPLAQVSTYNQGKQFNHVMVPLDGHIYVGCDFKDVKFIYTGMTPILMQKVTIEGATQIVTSAPLALAILDSFNLAPTPDQQQEQEQDPGLAPEGPDAPGKVPAPGEQAQASYLLP